MNSSSDDIVMHAATDYQYDNEGVVSGNYVEIDGNGTYNDTVTFYIPFTYGTAFGTNIPVGSDGSGLRNRWCTPRRLASIVMAM